MTSGCCFMKCHCNPFYGCIITLLLSFDEYIVSLFKLALGVCHCGMQRVMIILNIRIFRADTISYFMDFKNLKAFVDSNCSLPITFPNHLHKVE